MVHTAEHVKNERRMPLLSTGQVLEALGITKQTLYKWIMLGRIKAITHEIGKRVFLEFDPKEVERVKSRLKKLNEQEKGKSLLKSLLLLLPTVALLNGCSQWKKLTDDRDQVIYDSLNIYVR